MIALNLGKIRTAEDHFERVYEPGELEAGSDDFRVTRPVSLQFDIYKDKRHFRLVGRVETTLELNCSRCLDPFPWPVDASFDLRYQPLALNTGEGEREIQEDDLTTAFYQNDEIDLGQMMQEQFYLTLPMKPEELEAVGKSSVKTEVLGRETLDGHACVKNKIIITPPKGEPQTFTVWNATDLKDFPIQTLTRQDTDTVITRYTNVQLLKPDAKQFEPPAGFEEYKGLAAFQAGMMKKSLGGGTPAAK